MRARHDGFILGLAGLTSIALLSLASCDAEAVRGGAYTSSSLCHSIGLQDVLEVMQATPMDDDLIRHWHISQWPDGALCVLETWVEKQATPGAVW